MYPVRIARSTSKQNEVLELYLYRNEYQLATKDALYSDGKKYKPLRMAFNALGKRLGQVKNVLMLGGGLASGAQILAQKGYFPRITLVEHDSVIIEWAMALLPDSRKVKVVPQCEPAELFVEKDEDAKYDMLVCDIFNSRVVPEFVTSHAFLQKCRRKINNGGHFVLNYIVNKDDQWQKASKAIDSVFPDNTILSDGINKVVIARV